MSQNAVLLAALKRGESLTTLKAMRMEPPICRLSERIRELEREGVVIDRTRVHHNGKHYTAYQLRGQLEIAAA